MMGLAVLTDLHTSITGELAKLELLSLSYNFLSSLPPTLPHLSFLR
jgi:Leucine-rich repeat (LRR) protein